MKRMLATVVCALATAVLVGCSGSGGAMSAPAAPKNSPPGKVPAAKIKATPDGVPGGAPDMANSVQ